MLNYFCKLLLFVQDHILIWDFFPSFYILLRVFPHLSLICHFLYLLILKRLLCWLPSFCSSWHRRVSLMHACHPPLDCLSVFLTFLCFLHSFPTVVPQPVLSVLRPLLPLTFSVPLLSSCSFPLVLDAAFVAPCVTFVTLLPYFILSLCGCSVRSRRPGGRWEMVDLWFERGFKLFKNSLVLKLNTILANSNLYCFYPKWMI